MKQLSVSDFESLIKKNAEIIDTRATELFKEGFIPGSIHIPWNRKFESRLIQLVPANSLLLVISTPDQQEDLSETLRQNGYHNMGGFLNGGFDAWKQQGKPIDMIIEIETDELAMDLSFDPKLLVVDVRDSLEFAEGHLKDAVNLSLANIIDPLTIAQFDPGENIVLHCGGGSRSVIAASILKKHGLHNLHHVAGGWKKMKEMPKAKIVKDPGALN